MTITVAIVPHTHWDREWYEPFQTFRMRLVKLLDTLLPMLETDASYARFMLDGQTVDTTTVNAGSDAPVNDTAAVHGVLVPPPGTQHDVPSG